MTTDPARDDAGGAARPTSTASTRPSSASPATSTTISTSAEQLGVAVEQGEKLPSGGYEVSHGTQ